MCLFPRSVWSHMVIQNSPSINQDGIQSKLFKRYLCDISWLWKKEQLFSLHGVLNWSFTFCPSANHEEICKMYTMRRSICIYSRCTWLDKNPSLNSQGVSVEHRAEFCSPNLHQQWWHLDPYEWKILKCDVKQYTINPFSIVL